MPASTVVEVPDLSVRWIVPEYGAPAGDVRVAEALPANAIVAAAATTSRPAIFRCFIRFLLV
jgi:hypothetical protein